MEGSGLCIILFVLGSSVQNMVGGVCQESHCRHGLWNPHYCRCVCFQGYTGQRCEQHYDPCHGVDCHHGDCYHDSNFRAQCRCDPGYHGYTCTERDPCHALNCYHGTCHVSGGNGAYCTCAAGYYGTHCTDFDPCRSFNCGTGTCMMVSAHVGLSQTSLPRCNCPYGYYGSHCEKYDPCHNYACGTGTCRLQANHVNAYCTCPPGYYGDHCEHRVTTTVKTTVPTTTSTVSTTTTTVATTTAKPYVCTSPTIVSDLAHHVTSYNAMSSSCVHKDNAGSEAFVMNHCNVDRPASWTKGENVMLLCNGAHGLTPISTFSNGAFHAGIDIAAIFLSCFGEQIMVGLQTCDGELRIEQFSKGAMAYSDTDLYFVIQ